MGKKVSADKPPDPKKECPLFENKAVRDAWEEYRQMRIRIKKPFVGFTESRAISTLMKISGGDPDKAVAILQQSTDNCWQGLFEIKKPTASTNKARATSEPPRMAKAWASQNDGLLQKLRGGG